MKRLATLTATLLAFTAVPAALASGGLGTFKTTLKGKGANTEHGMLDGTWTLGLTTPGSGTVKLDFNGKSTGHKGTYVISGSTITLTPGKGGQCTTVGKYTYKLSGDTLTFATIKDTCTSRRDILAYGPWTMAG